MHDVWPRFAAVSVVAVLSDATSLETFWTVVGAISLLLWASLLIAASRDEVRRNRLGVNGMLALWSQAALVLKATMTLVSLLLTLAGLVAIDTPNRPNFEGDPRITLASVFIPTALIVIEVLIALLGAHRWVMRWQINVYETQQRRRDRRSTDCKDEPS